MILPSVLSQYTPTISPYAGSPCHSINISITRDTSIQIMHKEPIPMPLSLLIFSSSQSHLGVPISVVKLPPMLQCQHFWQKNCEQLQLIYQQFPSNLYFCFYYP